MRMLKRKKVERINPSSTEGCHTLYRMGAGDLTDYLTYVEVVDVWPEIKKNSQETKSQCKSG